MTPETREWVGKAEGDYHGALTLRRSRRTDRHDLVCFHCQQCAEKYLKAALVEAFVKPPKTHSLDELLDLLVGLDALWGVLRPVVGELNRAAVVYRYPGNIATAAVSRRALESCKQVRAVARARLSG